MTLTGVRDARQLVVSGKYADGTARDLTAMVEAKVEPAGVVDLQDGLFLRPVKNGTATVVINANGKETRVPVTVAGLDKPAPVSFRRDVIAALNVGGCNAGACHGTPSGKNGFKLSLRGFDPAADFLQLTREQFGRRTDKHDAGSEPDAAQGPRPRAARGRAAVRRDQHPGRDDDRVARRGAEGRRRRRCPP